MDKNSYLFVDGYNVLNSWDIFQELKDTDLSHARDLLVDMMANYAAFKGCKAVVVFDAYAVKTPIAIEQKAGVQVVFTEEGETADSYIEKTAYNLLRLREKIFVVTGDHSEQLMILGMGAYRITAGELLEDYITVCKDIKERGRGNRPLSHRREIASRINDDVLYKLERLRRKKEEG